MCNLKSLVLCRPAPEIFLNNVVSKRLPQTRTRTPQDKRSEIAVYAEEVCMPRGGGGGRSIRCSTERTVSVIYSIGFGKRHGGVPRWMFWGVGVCARWSRILKQKLRSARLLGVWRGAGFGRRRRKRSFHFGNLSVAFPYKLNQGASRRSSGPDLAPS